MRHIMKEKAENSGRMNTKSNIASWLRSWISKFQQMRKVNKAVLESDDESEFDAEAMKE